MKRSHLRVVATVAVLAAAFVVLSGLLAQPPVAPGKRYAVLVGVKDYDHSKLKPLDYPENDVDEMAKILAEHKYEVALLTNTAGKKSAKFAPTLANVEARLAEVLEKCKTHDTVIVALAGHGLQFEKQKRTEADDAYFCPQDAKPLADRRETLLSLKKLYTKLDESGAGVKLLLVDACRVDPRAGRGRVAGVDGSTAPRPPRGVAALFSCSAGEQAFESDKLKHGVFFHYVLEGLKGKAKDADGEVSWDGLQTYVRKRVTQDVGVLIGGGARQTPTLNAGELAGASPTLLNADQAQAPSEPKEYTSKTTGMKFVRIKAGTFTMGSSRVEQDDVAKKYYEGKRQDWMDNETAHEVTLTKDFYLGVHEVTRGQFRKFVEDDGYKTEAESDGKGGWGYDADAGKFEGRKSKYTWRSTGFTQTDEHPVVNVTWNDAVKFAAWLSRKDGREYRLPTEAEWEFACRGGSTSRYHSGDGEADLEGYSNIADQSTKSIKGINQDLPYAKFDDGFAFSAPVGSFKPNKFGLYDMHGNAYEWCADWYDNYASGRVTDPSGPATGSIRVFRGGSWIDTARYCRSAYRFGYVPSYRFYDLGFRLALVPSGR